MKCAARYQKPTLVLRENNKGYSRGSARGINNSKLEDLKGYLTELGLFEYCQGHS
jgi:single-stranded-DNA-specific exonuclease